MKKEKLKIGYERAEVEIVLLELSDIVTTSDPIPYPDLGDVGGDWDIFDTW